MSEQKLTNKNLDAIGTKMLKAICLQDHDIDLIVCADELFEPVRAAMTAPPMNAKDSLFDWTSFFVRRLRTRLIVAAVPVGFIAFYLIRIISTEPISYKTVPPIEYPAAVADIGSSEIAFTVTKNTPNRPAKSIAKQRHAIEGQDVGEFQTLTYTGEASDTTAGQIVRVELPRSSLFAMGVDLQVENQRTDKVKADLLIGEDGVMRAVRVVNQGEIR